MQQRRTLRVPGVDRLPEGEGRKVRVARSRGGMDEILLCRVGGELFALDTLCPHEGGRLAEGPLVGGRYAMCPLHLYRFDPRDGRAVGVECAPARTYQVREEEQEAVLVLVPEEEGGEAPSA